MDQRIRDAFNDRILAEALSRFGVRRENARLLDGFESFIYAYEKGGKDYILRISHSLHRASGAIQGEIEWVNYLADHGVPAARAVLSRQGNLVEPIDAGGGAHFTAVSFAWARGDHPTRADWENGLPGKLGQIVGRMHALTKRFEPSQARFRRPEWHEDYYQGYAAQYLSPSDTAVIAKFGALLEYLHTLPGDGDSYGLIHIDVHGGNFFIDDGQVTLFDFDDCAYAWFVYDIAMALFYAISHDCVSVEDVNWARRFLTEFMQGYRRENDIDPWWMKQIPHFLKLREIDLYIVIHRSLDLSDLGPWEASFMANRKYKIEHDVPYVELDWDACARVCSHDIPDKPGISQECS